MRQTASIISTYSADVFGVCSALFELGGMTIMHDASGCNSTYSTHDEPRWYDMDSMVYISALSEMEAVMGDDEKLIEDIADAAEQLHPKFIAIAGTPIPTMTGFDFEAVAGLVEQRTGIPCFGFPTTGMNTYVHGASMALAGIARRFVEEPDRENSGEAKAKCRSTADSTLRDAADGSDRSMTGSITRGAADEKHRSMTGSITRGAVDENHRSVTGSISRGAADADHSGTNDSATGRAVEEIASLSVNILGLTPLDFSINGMDKSIAAFLESRGFHVVSRWAMGCSLEELAQAGNADVNLVVSAVGLGAAKVLEERFHIPYVTGLPIGDHQKEALCQALKEAAESGESRGCLSDLPEEESQIVLIGEGISTLAIASAIEWETGRGTKVLCATECDEQLLRRKDRMTPDEDDIIPELAGAKIIIADPLYRPICPPEAKFVSMPSEAFSGRIFRSEIIDLVSDLNKLLEEVI